MAINPVQLVGLQRQTPDFVGQFLRGRQSKQEGDRQNRLLQIQEQRFESQQATDETKRKQLLRTAEAQFFGKAGEILAATPEGQQGQVFDQVRQMATAQGLDISDFPQEFSPEVLSFIQNEAALQGFTPTIKDTVALGEDQRLVEKGTGKEIVGVAGGKKQAPNALVKGLPKDVQSKAIEAFNLAGGGKDGVKAAERAIEVGRKQTLRSEVPEILDASFPQASPAERRQLEAAVQAGKTVESGLKQAEKIRTEQRRLKKAKDFQARTVSLIDKILANDELSDVIGSIEGRIGIPTSDKESEAVADIEEAQNILTAENMDLMSGVLSESDLRLLKNLSSGALNRTRSEGRFRADAQKLRDKLSSKLVQTVDDSAGTTEIETKRARLAELRAKAGL